MSETLSVRDLKLVRAISSEGSVAGAARQLHCSQPTASHHLVALEAKLGSRIADRGPRGATLTEIGEILAAHADRVLDQLMIVEGELARHAEFGVVALRVGTIPSAGVALLSPAIPPLTEVGIPVELVEAEAPPLLEMLHQRELHLVLTSTTPGERIAQDDDIDIQVIHEDPLAVLLRRDHRLAAQPTVALDDLRGERWISGRDDDDPCHGLLLQGCWRRGFDPELAYRINDYQLTEALVVATGAVALMPLLQLSAIGPGAVVRPLAGEPIHREIQAVRLSSVARGPTDRMIEELRKVAADLPDRGGIASGPPSAERVGLTDRK